MSLGLIIKSDPASPVQADGVTGVDWGVTDGLLVTNMGDLLGQRFLRRIKELDERLTVACWESAGHGAGASAGWSGDS